MAIKSTFLDKLKLAAIKAVEETADKIFEETKASFLINKTGIKHRRLPRPSSAIGETPAYQTGQLSRSMKKDTIVTSNYVESTLSVNVPYAEYLVRKERPILSYGAKKHKVSMFLKGISLIK